MINRRQLIASLLGLPLTTLPGCAGATLPPEGELLTPNHRVGHKIRDGHRVKPTAAEESGVIIVGAGMAGLSAAWRLLEGGFDDFIVLEMEPTAGGTAHSDRYGEFSYPWGAQEFSR